jgi:hypothetical protein
VVKKCHFKFKIGINIAGRRMMECKNCGSQAINHNLHGRDGSDSDLCDVCFWRKRYEIIKCVASPVMIDMQSMNIASGSKLKILYTHEEVINYGRQFSNSEQLQWIKYPIEIFKKLE